MASPISPLCELRTAAIAENTSGAPLPSANSVTPCRNGQGQSQINILEYTVNILKRLKRGLQLFTRNFVIREKGYCDVVTHSEEL